MASLQVHILWAVKGGTCESSSLCADIKHGKSHSVRNSCAQVREILDETSSSQLEKGGFSPLGSNGRNPGAASKWSLPRLQPITRHSVDVRNLWRSGTLNLSSVGERKRVSGKQPLCVGSCGVNERLRACVGLRVLVCRDVCARILV